MCCLELSSYFIGQTEHKILRLVREETDTNNSLEQVAERLYYKQRVAASQGICLNDETSTFDREVNVKLNFGKILKSLSLLYFSKEWELLFKYLFTFIKTVRGDTFVTNDLHFSGKTNRIFPPCDDIVGGWLRRVTDTDFQTCSRHIFNKNDGIKAATMWGLKLNEQCTVGQGWHYPHVI